ncbi:hypothetical protein BDV26DRAFT_228536 [Aspergillus bertholletiae]|uniref:Uncharacterized protein n=1 Tax=Aspergillus bertholletiae TaxID=1226010 RepID=A0A5N7B5N0_9EURO|nr:hypothetical protein BDV26DRAFT_228536 [Aspergillus bertholletiae]
MYSAVEVAFNKVKLYMKEEECACVAPFGLPPSLKRPQTRALNQCRDQNEVAMAVSRSLERVTRP